MHKRTVAIILAVMVQLVILAIVPAQKIIPRIIGRTIVLQVRPVDPYSIMSGYYATLGYDIDRPTGTEEVFGEVHGKTTFFVVLKAGPDDVWLAKSVHPDRPTVLEPDEVVIRGKVDGWRVTYGIERFYIPEAKRDEIDKALRENASDAKAEVAVDRFGNAALLRLRINDKVYSH